MIFFNSVTPRTFYVEILIIFLINFLRTSSPFAAALFIRCCSVVDNCIPLLFTYFFASIRSLQSHPAVASTYVTDTDILERVLLLPHSHLGNSLSHTCSVHG